MSYRRRVNCLLAIKYILVVAAHEALLINTFFIHNLVSFLATHDETIIRLLFLGFIIARSEPMKDQTDTGCVNWIYYIIVLFFLKYIDTMVRMHDQHYTIHIGDT